MKCVNLKSGLGAPSGLSWLECCKAGHLHHYLCLHPAHFWPTIQYVPSQVIYSGITGCLRRRRRRSYGNLRGPELCTQPFEITTTVTIAKQRGFLDRHGKTGMFPIAVVKPGLGSPAPMLPDLLHRSSELRLKKMKRLNVRSNLSSFPPSCYLLSQYMCKHIRDIQGQNTLESDQVNYAYIRILN